MKKSIISGEYVPYIIILVMSFLLYGNTIRFDYALDDLIVIKNNSFTQKGFGGIKDIFSYDSFTGFYGKEKQLVAGGRYRPLSIASFAVEYEIFKGLHPGASHFMNILFYAITGMILYFLLSILLGPFQANQQNRLLSIPFIATVLFLAHPVHAEVVANIKGRDEIFALMFSLLATITTLYYLEKRRWIFLPASALFFFLGLLSKENTIMFLAIIPMTIYFFTSHRWKENLLSMVPLAVAALLFIYIRFLALGYFFSTELPRELLNNPFVDATTGERYGTIFYTFGVYLRLLVFPHPLTHDYYPYHIPLVAITDARALLPMVIHLALLIFAILKLGKKSLVACGILFYMTSFLIVSNLLFGVGTFMNERFIYIPSLGFVLILAWIISDRIPALTPKTSFSRYLVPGIMIAVISLCSVKTISRNRAWKDDFTLFSTDVKTSANSTKCNTSAGGKYLELALIQADPSEREEYFRKAFFHLERGRSIYPHNTNCILLYAYAKYAYNQDYRGALEQYMYLLSFHPMNEPAYTNSIKILYNLKEQAETDFSLSCCKFLYGIDPGNARLNYMIGHIYGRYMGKADSAEYFLKRAAAIDPNDADAYKDLGVIYGMQGKYMMALEVLQKAVALDPSDQKARRNLEVTERILRHRPGAISKVEK